jgi:DNA ligase-1
VVAVDEHGNVRALGPDPATFEESFLLADFEPPAGATGASGEGACVYGEARGSPSVWERMVLSDGIGRAELAAAIGRLEALAAEHPSSKRLLAELVRTSKAVASTAARSKKTALIAEHLRRLDAREVGLAVAYLCGEVPQGRLGVGYSTLADTEVAPATESSLTLSGLDERLSELAACKGGGSARRRTELLGRLFSASTEDEQRFLRHLLVGELRQGALEGVVVEAVASAFELEPDRLRRAVMLNGELAQVAEAVRKEGPSALDRFGLVLFRPLSPMLAQSAANVGEAIDLGAAVFEHKFDGARVQVHKDADRVAVYTRSLHEVSARVPEVVELVKGLRARSVVLDGEVLGMRADGRPEPFQVTMRRFGRKDQTEALRQELPLSAFFFDVLHADGDDLVDRPLTERSETLAAIVPSASRVPRLATGDGALAERFLADALALGREGVVAKSAGAPYEAGRRGAAWLKIKPTHTLDLVVLAAEWGSGRRHGKLSNIHLGARDPATGSYVVLGKTFKGMTDAMLAWQTEQFLKLALGREGHVVHVRPELVVEVAFDGVQTSTQYPGGVALRFARVKRYRTDKSANEADSIDSVRRLLVPGSSGSED